MFVAHGFKCWLNWRVVRAHVCTLAVAVSLNSSWRVPRDSFRYGAAPYLVACALATATVGLPLALMQLAIGQLSQQDAVGCWRAVPFFKGVGYVKLLVSFLTAIYTMVYLAVTLSFFFHTMTNNGPQDDTRREHFVNLRGLQNAAECYEEAYLLSAYDDPELYVSVGVLVIAFWMLFPFMLYNPVKFMKRSFYSLSPIVLVLCIVVAACIGQSSGLTSLVQSEDWLNCLQPFLWHGAFTQAMISSQISGGFIISAGYSVYAYNNVVWSAFVLAGTNLAASAGFVLFWYATGDSGAAKERGTFAVLAQAYSAAAHRGLPAAWPAAISAMLFFSGIITMITLLFPVFERLRALRALRWRGWAAGVAAGGALLSAASVGAPAACRLLDDVAVPLLAHFAVAVEVVAFTLIYGWRKLLEDIEFLTGRGLGRYWALSWCVAPAILVPLSGWWAAGVAADGWPWRSAALLAAVGLATLVVAVFAACAVAHQCQFDIVSKVKASFTPSRHWGPRDPITHYYWLWRRDEIQRGETTRSRWQIGQLGQLSPRAAGSLAHRDSRTQLADEIKVICKLRSNSDDFFWTVYRRDEFRTLHENKRRSRSLDWRHIFSQQKSPCKTLVLSAFDIHTTTQTQQEEIENVVNAKVEIEPEQRHSHVLAAESIHTGSA